MPTTGKGRLGVRGFGTSDAGAGPGWSGVDRGDPDRLRGARLRGMEPYPPGDCISASGAVPESVTMNLRLRQGRVGHKCG